MSGVPALNVDMVTTAASVAIVPASAAVTSTSNLTVGTCTTTPLTPEILNSVMAMTNPLEYSFPTNTTTTTTKLSQVKKKIFDFWMNFNFHLFHHIYMFPIGYFNVRITI